MKASRLKEFRTIPVKAITLDDKNPWDSSRQFNATIFLEGDTRTLSIKLESRSAKHAPLEVADYVQKVKVVYEALSYYNGGAEEDPDIDSELEYQSNRISEFNDFPSKVDALNEWRKENMDDLKSELSELEKKIAGVDKIHDRLMKKEGMKRVKTKKKATKKTKRKAS
jgi:hypothetical protein